MAGLAVLLSWELLKGSHDFLHSFSMALYYKWGVKTGFTFALQFFMPIFDSLDGVKSKTFFLLFIQLLLYLLQSTTPLETLKSSTSGCCVHCIHYLHIYVAFIFCGKVPLCAVRRKLTTIGSNYFIFLKEHFHLFVKIFIKKYYS